LPKQEILPVPIAIHYFRGSRTKKSFGISPQYKKAGGWQLEVYI